MTFQDIKLYLIFVFLIISVPCFPEEMSLSKQPVNGNPYGWAIERIPWNVQDLVLREQKWVKGEESFLYPMEENRFLDATVYSLKRPKERIDVVWQEYEGKQIPYLIRIAGESSKWHLGEKITLGKNWAEIEKVFSKTFQLDRIPMLMDGPMGSPALFRLITNFRISFSIENDLLTKILPVGTGQSDISQIEDIELLFKYEPQPDIDDDDDQKMKPYLFLREIKVRFPRRGNLLIKKPPLKSLYLLNPGTAVRLKVE